MYIFLCTHALPHKETKVYRQPALAGKSVVKFTPLGTEFFPHELGEIERKVIMWTHSTVCRKSTTGFTLKFRDEII